jgi:hypothetical protein
MPLAARDSVRVICDEEGLTVNEKNDMCATIGGASGWRINAIDHNRVDGKVISTDFGISLVALVDAFQQSLSGHGLDFGSYDWPGILNLTWRRASPIS